MQLIPIIVVIYVKSGDDFTSFSLRSGFHLNMLHPVKSAHSSPSIDCLTYPSIHSARKDPKLVLSLPSNDNLFERGIFEEQSS